MSRWRQVSQTEHIVCLRIGHTTAEDTYQTLLDYTNGHPEWIVHVQYTVGRSTSAIVEVRGQQNARQYMQQVAAVERHTVEVISRPLAVYEF